MSDLHYEFHLLYILAILKKHHWDITDTSDMSTHNFLPPDWSMSYAFVSNTRILLNCKSRRGTPQALLNALGKLPNKTRWSHLHADLATVSF